MVTSIGRAVGELSRKVRCLRHAMLADSWEGIKNCIVVYGEMFTSVTPWKADVDKVRHCAVSQRLVVG